MAKTLLYELIQNYVRKHDHGIFLLPVPTGYGKTYSSIDYITDQVIVSHERTDKPKFIFVTNLKKNLKEEDFREMFEKKGYPELFEKEFFFLKNNVDSVIQQYGKTAVPKDIRSMESYQLLGKKINGYKEFCKTVSVNTEMKMICKKMVADAERDFRKDISKYLFRELDKNQMENWEPVLKEPDKYPKYKWVFDLFPAAYIYSKSIFAMSMDKFLLPIDPIFKKGFCLYEADKDFSSNRTIFLDEIDASKEVMINRLVENEVSHYVNQIELFVKLHDSFEKCSFHSDLLKKKKGSFEIDIQKLYTKGHEIFAQYNLQNGNIQTSEEMKGNANFLFHDGTYFTALNRKEGCIYYSIDFDPNKNCNIISIVTGEKPANELGDLIRRVKNFISESIYLFINMANSFMLRKNLEKKEAHLIEFENALQTVISEIVYLSREETEFILKTACMQNNSKLKSSQHIFDGSFYENGFSLNEFLDDEKHLLRTEIGTHQIHLTPEKIMAEIGARYCLIGMSATAEIQTDLKNYHWRYIKKYLKEDFVSLTAMERKKIEEDYHSTIAGYENIELKAIVADVKLIKSENEIVMSSEFSRFFERCSMTVSRLQDYVKMNLAGKERKTQEFYLKRYGRLFCAYMEFLENAQNYGMQSMLYLSMKLPKENDPEFDLAFIKKCLPLIQKLYTASINDEFFVILNSEDYDAKREQILSDLSSGKKRFIVSSYKTIGAGQNMDYLPPKNCKTVKVGKKEDTRVKKDIDSIFLEAPTTALKTRFDSEQDRLAAIIEREYLKANGEYTAQELERNLKKIIGKQLCAEKDKNENNAVRKNNQIPSVRKYYDLLILQALGRISRSVVKSETIRIYVSDDIFNFFYKKEILHDKIIPSPELNAIFSLCDEMCLKEPDYDKEILAAADIRSNEFSSLLSNWISLGREEGSWRIDVMKEYKHCGELSLKCLQPNVLQYENDYQNFYIELPYKADRYYYNYSGDYHNIRISMYPQVGKEIFPYCVSVQDSRIDLFLKWSGYKEYMENLGYQAEFLSASKIWPSPAAFNNIYKGRIGEVFGKYLFLTIGIELEEITDPQTFELFDFKVKNKNIYVDFKNRKDSVYSDEENMIRWIRQKKEKIGKCSVIICNIYEETGNIMEYGDGIVTIPSLVNDFEKEQLEPKAVKKILEVYHEDK